jgi:hypothetical protein
MIYTLGHTESYEQYLSEPSPTMKKGKCKEENYEGGSVWRSYSEPDGLAPQILVFME